MPYFQLNGFACIEPASLMGELNALSSGVVPMDASSDEWAGKANAFHHRRGVDPSEGYLLVQNPAFKAGDSSELLIQFDGFPTTRPDGKPLSSQQIASTQNLYSKFFRVEIDWARKASPASQPNQGYYFVRVVDARNSLSKELVGKRFNYPIDYIPNEITPAIPGEFVYHKMTIKEEENKYGEITHRPYTWEELFKECFILPGQEVSTLNTLRVEYPEYVPQDLDFRYVTRRDALEMLCQWCNISIEWDGLNEYKLIQVKDTGGKIDALLNAHAYRTTKNVFGRSVETPHKLLLHFPYLQPESQHTSIYEAKKSGEYEDHNGEMLSLWLPCVKLRTSLTPPPKQDPSAVTAKFKTLQKDYFDQLPSQEKIYRGLIFQSPGVSAAKGPDPLLQIKPSGYLESVVWYDIGRGPRTQIVSAKVRKWLICPRPVIQRGLVAAIGKVVDQVTEEAPAIKVKQLRLINPAGCLPLGVEQLSEDFIVANNTFKKAYAKNDTILVFGEDYAAIWDTDNSGGASTPLARFELIEDKPLKSFAVKAVLLNEFGVALPAKEPVDPQKPNDPQKDSQNVIYVIDGQQRFAGYKKRVDPLYGEQRGFVGAAVKVLDNYEFGNKNSPPGYVIIEMEHVARYVEGKLRQAYDPDNGETEGDVIITGYWDGRAPSTKKVESETTGGSPAFVVTFKDRQQLFGKQSIDAKVKLIFDETINEFKTNETPSGGQGPVTDPSKYVLWVAIPEAKFPVIYAWCDSDVPAATLDVAGKKGTWGTKELKKMVESDDGVEVPSVVADIKTVKVKNSATSIIRGSYEEPLILIGVSKIVDKTFPPDTNTEDIPPSERQEEIMLVLNWIDPRGFTNYVKGKAQGLFHRPDERNFELGGKDCQNTTTA